MSLRRRIAVTSVVGAGLLAASVPFAISATNAAPAPAVIIPCPTSKLLTVTPTAIEIGVGCFHGSIPLTTG